MSHVDTLLSKLDGVKATGEGRWMARSPTREDRTPSLAIRVLPDGRILIHDFGGDSVHEIVSAVGLTLSDLFPPREPGVHGSKGERRPFPAVDVLRAISREAGIVAVAAGALLNGRPFSPEDRERLALAVSRISEALAASGVGYGR